MPYLKWIEHLWRMEIQASYLAECHYVRITECERTENMRKAQKQQAEDFVKLLDRAHKEIKKAIERKDGAAAADLLEQCQDGAIELGNMIEAEEGEGFVTVSLLEEYCELVYQIHEAIWHKIPLNGNKTGKSLRKMLIRIENSIREDIKVRLEAVFLPYKASMWDSLESVWKAAEEDPNCDAYVVPIPYFDKNPDGSFKEMHYEGEDYPDYVPITWYEDYDFAEHRPDMIFIHNPYDECNYVTSVHPFFYAKNLKQFTEKLVYIPYFILGEPDPENEKSVEGIAHFCTVPGVLYADKVIVQSEAMRQVYIRVMTEFTGGQMCHRAAEGKDNKDSEANPKTGKERNAGTRVNEAACRKYWEEKILGLGSPKVDKVLGTRKEDLQIPEEWLRVIRKEDGSWKKIIFYNTSVTALLEHEEKMLAKMRDVFRVFEENQDEVALLWRPHPLIRATIESMRPGLWEEYEGIVREYKKAGWGIYDDTADVDRVVALSDGYYGDPSSVVELCRNRGLCTMIQNIDIRSDKDSAISNDGMFMENEKTWFVGNLDGIIYQMNLSDMLVRAEAVIPENIGSTYRISTGVIKKDQKLYCLPDQGRFIWVFDTEKRNFRKIEIKNPYFLRISIFDKWIVNETLWCVSYGMNQIIEVDLQTEQIAGYYDIFSDSEDSVGYLSAFVGKTIYCVSRTSKRICAFDIGTKRAEYYGFDIKGKGFNTIAFDGKRFWLSGYAGEVYCWDKEKENILISDPFPDDYRITGDRDENGCFTAPLFYQCAVMKEYVIFIPWNSEGAVSESLISVNRENMEIRIVPSEKMTKPGENFAIEYQKDERFLVLYNTREKCLEELDFEKQKIAIKKIKTDQACLGKFWEENYNPGDMILENSRNSIREFYSVLCGRHKDKSPEEARTGRQIFDCLYEKSRRGNH